MNSGLHIETGLRGKRTFLKKSYYTPPFKIADITEDRSEGTLRLMLMNSSPGVLSGDEYRLKIDVAECSCLCLQTQSYQRLFTMKENASQHFEIHQARGSSFYFLPHPTVPHRDSDFTCHNEIFLSENCNLIWGEVLTCGRNSDEVFQFSKFRNLTEIYVNSRMVIRENLYLKPSLTSPCLLGQQEGFTHQATLIYINDSFDIDALKKRVNEYLSLQQKIIFGTTTPPISGLVVKLLGFKAEQLHTCLKNIACILMSPTPLKTAACAT